MQVCRDENRDGAIAPAGHMVLLDRALPLADRCVVRTENMADVGGIKDEGIGLAAVLATRAWREHLGTSKPLP